MYNNTVTTENLKSLNEQEPATKNQIKNNKPSIIKNANVLEGYIANSINGGHIKPIAYQYVMAGSKIMDYRIRINLKMLTPKTPAYQKLKAVVKTYFVPNSRVWENAEKFLAQKGGNTNEKIRTIPNIGDGFNRWIPNGLSETEKTAITNTDKWRDSWISTYIPRYQSSTSNIEDNLSSVPFPAYSILPLRGFIAIYNDFERNKEYDTPLTEEKGNYGIEFEDFMTELAKGTENEAFKTNIRGKRQNSYYTNYRTELLGEIENAPNQNNDYLVTLQEWEKKIAEFRSQAEDAQLNDWDIIAKIRGSKPLTEGKVQLLGTREIGLNYISVPQTTYNTNEEISEEFQSLGTEGAYSFTEADVSMFKMQDFNEEGYLHTIIQITADSVFETAFDRIGLNVNYEDIYRPDLKELKNDVLYDIEKGSSDIYNIEQLTKVTGYKRKFSEYFKGTNCISGDIMSEPFYQTISSSDKVMLDKGNTQIPILIENQRSYQFFETNERWAEDLAEKNIWQDYTDLLINENQAYKQQIERNTTLQGKPNTEIKGQNQIFFLGKQIMVIDMPIDENIKANYTKWGEK